MDKKSIRRHGIAYRTQLSAMAVASMSQDVCQQLRPLLDTLKGPYLSYTATLLGELHIAQAFLKKHAVFIDPYKDTPMDYDGFSTIVVPMVAGDRHGNRIGMGGGWFDRFLQMHPNVTIVGCCYDRMVVDELPHEQHDIRVDYICTETRTIRCNVE